MAAAVMLPTLLSPVGIWSQCGGIGWEGPTACVVGATCAVLNDRYSQCLPIPSPLDTPNTQWVAAVVPEGPSRSVGKLPALGWNTWNAHRCEINEQKIISAANAMVSLGLKDVGYEYINIDDCWSDIRGRNETTHRLIPDYDIFPNGIKAVADVVHDLGLKIGIYSDSGTRTCAGYPGSLGFEKIDVETWAEWGIDYLKYDNCNIPPGWSDPVDPKADYDWFNSPTAQRYHRMTVALNSVSRVIQFGLCEWGYAKVWTWGARVGHSWRIGSDSLPFWWNFKATITKNVRYLDYVDFYAHSDMDMMEIGNGRLTLAEQRSQFAIWVFMKSPILIGTNLERLSTEQLEILKNQELLAFHQDPTVGAPAKPYKADDTQPPEYYAGTSSKGSHVFVINFESRPSMKTITFSEISFLQGSNFHLHNMWTGKDLGTVVGSYSFMLDAHDTAAFLITGTAQTDLENVFVEQ